MFVGEERGSEGRSYFSMKTPLRVNEKLKDINMHIFRGKLLKESCNIKKSVIGVFE